MVLYEVYARRDPYEGEDPDVVLKDIADTERNYRPPVPKDCPPQLAGIMTDCFSALPDDRPSFEELDKRLRRVDVEMAQPKAEPRSSIFSVQRRISLHDIFPAHVADALRAGRQVEPEHRCECNVCAPRPRHCTDSTFSFLSETALQFTSATS